MTRRLFILLLVSLFLFSRLPRLDSGLNVLEPDEEDYREITATVEQGWPLYWQGKPYFEKYPFYIYTSYLVGKLIKPMGDLGPYVHLRLVSISASLGLAVLFYLYLKSKRDEMTATVTTLFLLLHPLVLFYSRQGTYELFFLFFGFLFVYAWQQFREKLTGKRLVLLGFLLFAAIIAKHINVLLLVIPALHFVDGLRRRNRQQMISAVVIVGIGGLFLFGSLLPVYLYSKELVFGQFIGGPSSFFISSPKGALANVWEYLKRASYWESWPIFFGTLIALPVSLRKFSQNKTELALFCVGWLYLAVFYVVPRSYIFFVPYSLLLLGELIHLLLKRPVGKIAIVVMIVLTLFSSEQAFLSTLHQGVEITLARAKELHQLSNVPVYATFEDDKLTELFDYPVTFLTDEATKGGIILTDERKTELMLDLSEPEYQEAHKVLQLVGDNYSPAFTYNDPYPHFPGSSKGNTLRIYVFDD